MTVFCEAEQHEDRDFMSYILDENQAIFPGLVLGMSTILATTANRRELQSGYCHYILFPRVIL